MNNHVKHFRLATSAPSLIYTVSTNISKYTAFRKHDSHLYYYYSFCYLCVTGALCPSMIYFKLDYSEFFWKEKMILQKKQTREVKTLFTPNELHFTLIHSITQIVIAIFT